jgi:hypothetical protein
MLSIVGFTLIGLFDKDTLTSYFGFVLLVVGVVSSVVGVCFMILASIENRLQREKPGLYRSKKTMPLRNAIWLIGAGLVFAILGLLLIILPDQTSLMTSIGFDMLFIGIGVSVFGLSVASMEIVKIDLSKDPRSTVKVPQQLLFSIFLLGLGSISLIVGAILAKICVKDTAFSYFGFGLLIAGVVLLCLGVLGTAINMLKAQFHGQDYNINGPQHRAFSSIWEIGIGAMFLIIGLILSGNFETILFIYYTSFSLLLSGAAIFAYGLFETVKASSTDYIKYDSHDNFLRQDKKTQPQNSTARPTYPKSKMPRVNPIFNIAGIISSVCILFFSIWQLDLIVSGPVWWSSEPFGQGYGWSHIEGGAYANDYFQCFLWKTTVGQAYDTLFMLIFISFIILFISAYFWPKQNNNHNLLKLQESEERYKNLQISQETRNSQTTTTTEHAPTTIEDEKNS